MNELLLRHGCCTVFSLPPGLKELMSDISREVCTYLYHLKYLHSLFLFFVAGKLDSEDARSLLAFILGDTEIRTSTNNRKTAPKVDVLREQPAEIYDFITNYLSALIITREHGVLAVKILDDLCDCRPTLVEHLLEIGFKYKKSTRIAEVVQTEIEEFEPTIGNEKFVEAIILKKVLEQFRNVPDDEQIAKLLQVIRNAYKDYWFRKNLMSQNVLNKAPLETWEQAVENTLNIYKKTKPSLAELHRATLKIQTAYRGYYIRRQMKKAPKFEIPHKVDTRPLDIAESREIDLGPFLKMTPKDDTSRAILEAHRQNVKYEPLHAIAFRPDRPDPQFTVLGTGSEDTDLSPQHSWEVLDEAALEKMRESERLEKERESEHKKISFAGVTLQGVEEETQSTAELVKTAHEDIPEDIAAGVVDDVIKAIPTGSLEQMHDQALEAGQENIPEEITERVPSQEIENDNVMIIENIHDQENTPEVPEEITEIDETGDQIHEAVPEHPEQGPEAIPEFISETAPEVVSATENAPEQPTNQEAYDDPTVEVQAMKKAQEQAAGLENQDPTIDYADHMPMDVNSLAPDMAEQQEEPRV